MWQLNNFIQKTPVNNDYRWLVTWDKEGNETRFPRYIKSEARSTGDKFHHRLRFTGPLKEWKELLGFGYILKYSKYGMLQMHYYQVDNSDQIISWTLPMC